MNIANEEFSEKLSLYVDGALPEQEAKEIESILEADASARRQADELRKLKALLSSREPLTPHAGLWTRVSLALDEEKKEEHNLLPFQRKHLPLVAGLVTAVFVAVGFIVMQNGMQLAQIISKGPGAVIDAVHNKNLQNSLLPLFASVDKDRALQFSLFGTLPLDKKSETALRVDEIHCSILRASVSSRRC
jgi:anti-sigma-K factor RskA